MKNLKNQTLVKKRLIYCIVLLMSGVIAVSCAKDDEEDDPVNKPDYSFIDQNLQGEIEGEAWELLAGSAINSFGDTTTLYVEMFAMASDNPCADFNLDGNRVIFHIPKAEGLYELSFDWSENSQTITLYHDATGVNAVASEGAIEITLIDEVNGLYEGRVVAEAGAGNSINGNFRIPFCN